MDTNQMHTISVGICTYKRPDLLIKCLESIIFQEKIKINQIIVVDNDILKSGATVISILNEKKQLKDINLVYEVEEKKGVSSARNKVVSLNKSDLLAFIDDDETADPFWLINLYNTYIKYKPDAVYGNIIYITPKEYEKSHKGLFKSKIGALKTGQNLNLCSTGNVLINRDILKLRNGPFNEELNNIGGEDTELFQFLKIKYNCTYIYCNEAKVSEYQSKERFNYRWHNHRAYRSGWLASYMLCLRKKRFQAFLFILFTIIPSFFKNIFIQSKGVNFRTFTFLITKYFYAQLGKLGYFLGFKLEDF